MPDDILGAHAASEHAHNGRDGDPKSLDAGDPARLSPTR